LQADFLTGLIETQDPLELIFNELTERYWSEGVFSGYDQTGGMESYLEDQEHLVSEFERKLWDVCFDMYALFETDHKRKHRIEELLRAAEYTLVVFDGLSLREIPAVRAVLSELGLKSSTDFALSTVPSDTTVFAQQHFHASGPAAMAKGRGLLESQFAFEHVMRQDWEPDFKPEHRRRVIWAMYPDNVFRLAPGSVSYTKHILEPIQSILRTVLNGDAPTPLIVTADHGYIWQGGNTAWALEPRDTRLLAAHFKRTRCTKQATRELAHSQACWVSGRQAAARGRFAWGAKVKGAPVLYTHGGVSLMECIVPWVSVGP